MERTVHEKTLKRVALTEFPKNMSASTLNLHNSNEQMLPMLQQVEQLVLESVLSNMENVKEAIKSLRDQLKAEFNSQWNCLVYRSTCARTAISFKTPYAQFIGPECVILIVWQ